jgi:excisionase family DNA binding protein
VQPERPTSPLFVRLPAADAERLDRASFELKRPKQELVAEALRALELPQGSVRFGFAQPGSEPAAPDVLTTEQLAELLQVEPGTVKDLVRRGELPGRKIGRDWRFSREAVLAWLGETQS